MTFVVSAFFDSNFPSIHFSLKNHEKKKTFAYSISIQLIFPVLTWRIFARFRFSMSRYFLRSEVFSSNFSSYFIFHKKFSLSRLSEGGFGDCGVLSFWIFLKNVENWNGELFCNPNSQVKKKIQTPPIILIFSSVRWRIIVKGKEKLFIFEI